MEGWIGWEEYFRHRKLHVQRSWGEKKLVIETHASLAPYMALPLYPVILWSKSFSYRHSQYKKLFPSPPKE